MSLITLCHNSVSTTVVVLKKFVFPLRVNRLDHQPSHKLFDLQFVLPARVVLREKYCGSDQIMTGPPGDPYPKRDLTSKGLDGEAGYPQRPRIEPYVTDKKEKKVNELLPNGVPLYFLTFIQSHILSSSTVFSDIGRYPIAIIQPQCIKLQRLSTSFSLKSG